MPDVYASIESAEEAVQERLAAVLELRAADAGQQAMLEDYLGDLPLPGGALAAFDGDYATLIGRRP